MENFGLILIFWYGVLHAFAPDHLSAIADFSIGKNKKKTIIITSLFAFGHGFSLFVFAKILEFYSIPSSLLAYGDTISALVIFSIGIYLLFMVFTRRINVRKHMHKGIEHIHIYFGKEHNHKTSTREVKSALAIGVLMGIGGVRGMLVTFALIESSSVDIYMIFAFTSGVLLIFLSFGACILYINENLLKSNKSVNIAFLTAGIVSVLVSVNMLT